MEIADVDGSGSIDLAEFKEFMSRLSLRAGADEDLDNCFKSADENGNGELNQD